MKARTWVAGLSSATMLATVGVVALSTAPAANAVVGAVAAGRIELATVYGNPGSGQFSFFKEGATTAAAVSQLGRGQRCALTLTNAGQVITVESTPSGANGTPGFGNGGIGVSSANKRSGTACTQVNSDASEALTLRFNGSAARGFFGPTKAYGGRLDLEVKGNATVTATLYDGQTAVRTQKLYGGTAGTSIVVDDNNTKCNGGTSDSGPDSTSGDNCPWNIGQASLVGDGTDTLFDRIELSVDGGAFSLEGGSDWGSAASSNRTVFNLASQPRGVLDCGDIDALNDSSLGNWSIEVERLPNASPGPEDDTCVLLPYGLAADGTSASFYKPPSLELTAAFTIKLTHKVASLNPSPVVTYDWEDGQGPVDVPKCDAAYYNGVGGNGINDIDLIAGGANPIIDYTALKAAVPDASNGTSTSLPGYQHACVYGQTSSTLADGGVVMVDYLWMTGDIKFAIK